MQVPGEFRVETVADITLGCEGCPSECKLAVKGLVGMITVKEIFTSDIPAVPYIVTERVDVSFPDGSEESIMSTQYGGITPIDTTDPACANGCLFEDTLPHLKRSLVGELQLTVGAEKVTIVK